MTVVFEAPGVTVHHGDCIEIMRTIPDASIDAIVTDPPYGLEFMGKDWDAPWQSDPSIGKTWATGMAEVKMADGARRLQRPTFEQRANVKCRNCHKWRVSSNPCRCDAPDFPNMRAENMAAFQQWCTEWASEAYRILKPGGHMLAFGGSRTWHRLASGIEDAGFEIRDSIAWLYGSGFPKSLDVSKAIDAAAGVEREVTREAVRPLTPGDTISFDQRSSTERERRDIPATEDAVKWDGWGTALKPAFEPIVVARKPLVGTVAANVLAHGTGALNIDATRVDWGSEGDKSATRKAAGYSDAAKRALGKTVASENESGFSGEVVGSDSSKGRWPTNVVLDDHTATELDQQSGVSVSGKDRGVRGRGGIWSPSVDGIPAGPQYGDSGGASRFFPVFRYEAKAPTVERPRDGQVAHPTVKPLELMRWLVRLVTPPDGIILEPFAGSGTTLEAAVLEGFQVVGIEREADYLPLIEARLTKPLQPVMFGDWDGAA